MAKQKKRAIRKTRVKRILNVNPSRNQENDWTIDHAAESRLVLLGAPPPASVDLREDAWWKIGDQGPTGSCVGWASADSVLRWHFTKLNRMTKQQRLSVRYIWMASKETDEFVARATAFIEESGTSLKAALDVARKFGVVLEDLLPFPPPARLFAGDEVVFYVAAAHRKIASYFNLKPSSLIPVVDIWRLWLATKGPILARLSVDATWENATNTQGKLDVYQPPPTDRGHAIALVGYTPDRFIVRNSWGTGWGDKGYGYASIGYATQAFTEAYGVVP